jgi:CAAX protease family protein
MRGLIRSLSARSEYAIVLLTAFGYFTFSSLVAVLRPSSVPPISQNHLEALLIYESAVLLLLGAFLHVRGWTMARLGISPTARDTLLGVCLAVAAYGAYVAIWFIASAAGAHPTYTGTYREIAAHSLALPVVLAVSILNPVYEETFLCGYIITVAKGTGSTTAGVNVSVAIRLLYHLYQGGVGVIGIIPFGLIFAWWYARTGRLWPLFVAHGLTDAAGLLQFVR